MSQSTPAPTPLGRTVVQHLIPACRAATSQSRVAQHLLRLTLGLVLVAGRAMLSRVLLVLGRADRDWSAAYRLFSCGRVDVDVLRRHAVVRWLALVGPHRPLVTVVDGTQLPRTGRRIPGAGW